MMILRNCKGAFADFVGKFCLIASNPHKSAFYKEKFVIHSYERIKPWKLDLLDWSLDPHLHAIACFAGVSQKTIQLRFHSIICLFSFNFPVQFPVDRLS